MDITNAHNPKEPAMTLIPRRITALALLCMALGSASAAGPSLSMAEAQQAYYQGHYGRSLALFERLAAAHNAEAAECAGFMLLHGDQLYGPQVRRNVPRARAFLLQAANSGRPGAGFILNMIERTD
jgi:TPR repeat protein